MMIKLSIHLLTIKTNL